MKKLYTRDAVDGERPYVELRIAKEVVYARLVEGSGDWTYALAVLRDVGSYDREEMVWACPLGSWRSTIQRLGAVARLVMAS